MIAKSRNSKLLRLLAAVFYFNVGNRDVDSSYWENMAVENRAVGNSYYVESRAAGSRGEGNRDVESTAAENNYYVENRAAENRAAGSRALLLAYSL